MASTQLLLLCSASFCYSLSLALFFALKIPNSFLFFFFWFFFSLLLLFLNVFFPPLKFECSLLGFLPSNLNVLFLVFSWIISLLFSLYPAFSSNLICAFPMQNSLKLLTNPFFQASFSSPSDFKKFSLFSMQPTSSHASQFLFFLHIYKKNIN